MISRLASTDPAKRRGVLLMNPGGPGGSGLFMPPAMVTTGLPASIRESYDLIGFDPRGVGFSSPVGCDLPPEHQLNNIPPYAQNSADVGHRAVVAQEIANLCANSPAREILPYINTANTARDMDRIRAALGERTISYFGYSYGTYLGAVYATLFPQRANRFVLDSVVGPGGFDLTASRRIGLGVQQRFPDFAVWVAARHETYGLGATPAAVTAKWFETAERLDREPVSGIDGKLFRLVTVDRLYNDARFPSLAQGWQSLTGQSAAKRAFPEPPVDNAVASQLHVICNDTDWPESVRVYQRNVALDRLRFPMFGAAASNIWPCAFWPTDPVERPVRISDRGPSNILLVQNVRDPASPLAGAREMRNALGERARLVTVDHGGHGVFLTVPNQCAHRYVEQFLVDGQRPARDLLCPGEDQPR